MTATVTQKTPEVRFGIKIPLRDNVCLSATLYLPGGDNVPAPAILTLTPYIGQTYHEMALFFATHGHPFLAVDVRGRGNSEGEFRPFITEGADGFDVVEWVARQHYCNGKVTMWGGSYAGYAQWVTAGLSPPHLETIVPVAAPYIGVDYPLRNNITWPYLLQWLTLVWGRASQDKLFWGSESFWARRLKQAMVQGVAFRQLDGIFGIPSPVFQEWINHPEQGPYWDSYNLTREQYERIRVPTLSITGIYDADQLGALHHYRELVKNAAPTSKRMHCLVIGPWDHAGTRTPQAQFAGMNFGPESVVDLLHLHLQWYAWTMAGGPRPEFLQKSVVYYVPGANEWRYADSLEEITSSHVTLYLGSNGDATEVFGAGMLSRACDDSTPDQYVYDPRDTSIADVEASHVQTLSLRPTFSTDDITDQNLVFAREGKQLVYHSAPFEEATEVSGFFKFSAWISIDQRDTDFNVSVYEVTSSGTSILLTSDVMRARYRESLRVATLITSTDPRLYDFTGFTFTSRLVQMGSRLRLIVGPIDSIHFQRNYNSGGAVADETGADSRVVTVKLFHEKRYPSALLVPVGRRNN